MYLAGPITTTTKPLYEYERHFAICESCFWCATVFHKADSSSNNEGVQQQICPLCKTKGISLIPLAKGEGYTIAMEGKRGLNGVLQTSAVNL
jgi:hypothetical protein